MSNENSGLLRGIKRETDSEFLRNRCPLIFAHSMYSGTVLSGVERDIENHEENDQSLISKILGIAWILFVFGH